MKSLLLLLVCVVMLLAPACSSGNCGPLVPPTMMWQPVPVFAPSAAPTVNYMAPIQQQQPSMRYVPLVPQVAAPEAAGGCYTPGYEFHAPPSVAVPAAGCR